MSDRTRYFLVPNKKGTEVHVFLETEKKVAVVYPHKVRELHRKLPKYIIDEAQNILKANLFELNRGFTLDGMPCQINDRREI